MSWTSDYCARRMETQAAKFEESVVDEILNHYGLRNPWRYELLRAHKRDHNRWALTLDDFSATFQDFPLSLSVSRTQSVITNHPLSKLLGNVKTLPLFREFSDLEENAQVSQSIGLAIKWPYYRGVLLLHNSVTTSVIGPRWVLERESGLSPLTLQSLRSYMKNCEWVPPNIIIVRTADVYPT